MLMNTNNNYLKYDRQMSLNYLAPPNSDQPGGWRTQSTFTLYFQYNFAKLFTKEWPPLFIIVNDNAHPSHQ